jgi:hypothetical protein
MLPQAWRIQAQNSTGVAFGASDTLEVTGQAWYINSSGALTYEANTVFLPATSGNSLASGGFANGTTQTGNTYFGLAALGEASISTATPAGNINFFLQYSPDGGTTWPANGLGQLIGVMVCTATGTQGNIQMSA